MKEWRKGCEVIWKCGLLDFEWKLPLGEHGGSGDMQDLTKERNGEREWKILNMTEAAAHRRLAVGHQSASRLLTHG